ncbi:MAG: orotate phosphoribosyltransferase [Thermoplasmata archaeon]|nr:MAG: orotate phosphoribosyltransferase [Thermoplasmata archaeon]
MREVLRETLRECGAFKTGEFVLSSGKKSNFYVDIKQASTNPRILGGIARQMKSMIKDEQKVAGMELGAVPLAVALSLESGLPYLIIRKKERTHGTVKLIEGNLGKGDSVLLVEDVTTTGSSLLRAAEILRQAGAKVERALVVVDREEGASELLGEHNIELVPMVRVSEMM